MLWPKILIIHCPVIGDFYYYLSTIRVADSGPVESFSFRPATLVESYTMIRYVWDTNLTKYRLLYLSALLHQTALQRCIGFARIERMPRIEYWKEDDVTGVLVEIFPT